MADKHPDCIYPLCGCIPSACRSDPATEIRRRISAVGPMCKCGKPWVLNTVHREHTPCYRAANPADGLGVLGPAPAKVFTDDEIHTFYEEWEFEEEDPGRLEFHRLVREVERRVLERTRGVAGTDGRQA